MISLQVPAFRTGDPLCNHIYLEDSYLRIMTCVHCGREMDTIHWGMS